MPLLFFNALITQIKNIKSRFYKYLKSHGEFVPVSGLPGNALSTVKMSFYAASTFGSYLLASDLSIKVVFIKKKRRISN